MYTATATILFGMKLKPFLSSNKRHSSASAGFSFLYLKSPFAFQFFVNIFYAQRLSFSFQFKLPPMCLRRLHVRGSELVKKCSFGASENIQEPQISRSDSCTSNLAPMPYDIERFCRNTTKQRCYATLHNSGHALQALIVPLQEAL